MPITVVGISHHTAPLEVREALAMSPERSLAALRALTDAGHAREAVVVSTCNRTELYLETERVLAEPTPFGARFLTEQAGLLGALDAGFFYTRQGRDAVEHLFRVVSSLDSMILGEAQIQGQVKAAYELAVHADPRPVGPVLARLFESSLGVGGRVRHDTALGKGAASIPSAAVALARKIFGSLRGRHAVVIGAGEMSALALECLAAEGIASLVVANRTEARARELAARFGGRSASVEELPALLAQAEIVATATSAPHHVLTRAMLEEVHPDGPRKPLLIVDIALPRDVEPTVGAIPNVFLYDIDDMQQVVEGTLEKRRSEVAVAERIIADGRDDFWRWYRSRSAVPVIRALRTQAEDIRRAETERALRALAHLPEEDRARVEVLTRQLMNKVLHAPTARLKEAVGEQPDADVLEAARYLFDLPDEDQVSDDAPHPPAAGGGERDPSGPAAAAPDRLASDGGEQGSQGAA